MRRRECEGQKGFELVCADALRRGRNLKDDDGKPLVAHPVACIDCHDPTRCSCASRGPASSTALAELAKTDDRLCRTCRASTRWRKGDRDDKRLRPQRPSDAAGDADASSAGSATSSTTSRAKASC